MTRRKQAYGSMDRRWNSNALLLLGIVLWVVLSACGSTAGTQMTAQPAAFTPPAVTPAPIPADVGPASELSPCTVAADRSGTENDRSAAGAEAGQADTASPSAAAPSDSSNTIEVRYDGDTRTIVLSKGSGVTLAALSRALDNAEVLQEVASGEWLLGANLRIQKGATVEIAAPEVRWLKLRSEGKRFASIRVLGGGLAFTNTCISSWDTERNSFDENYRDGRSFIVARDGATMTVHGSEVRNLGYNADESFGLAWRLADTRGEIVDSYVAYNYYGLYTYQVNDFVIRRNQVHNNVLYGLDPHTGSQRLVIENNLVHDNGKHGIILAEECSDSVVRNNVVYGNRHHGIVLYQKSNNTLVEGNSSYGNAEQGINVNDASGNTIRNNIVYGNLADGIGVGQQSSKNKLVANDVYANHKDGVTFYSEATDNALLENKIYDNGRYGVYVKSEGDMNIEGNEIAGNTIGVYMNVAQPIEVAWETNTMRDNREADIRAPGK